MFACIYRSGAGPGQLLALARQFSPEVECIGDSAVVFSVSGLRRLFGNPQQIASAISEAGERMGITAALAIAASPESASLAARNLQGITVILPGQEAQVLGQLPVETLQPQEELLATLRRWGIQTLEQLVFLPEDGVRERLGEAGCRLRHIALGREIRPLKVERPAIDYSAQEYADDPISLLEPLLFLISAQVHDLTRKLAQHGRAAGGLTVALDLAGDGHFRRAIELPFATRDPSVLLKQIQLSLAAKPPDAPITSVSLTLHEADPRLFQHGLFQAVVVEPDNLQTLIARLSALVGEKNVGSPGVLDTHRPDAHCMRPCAFEPSMVHAPEMYRPLKLALRYFRPPVIARVMLRNGLPQHVTSPCVYGPVTRAAGPWRTSGEWWTHTTWDRYEWDVLLGDGGLYRIYQASGLWFLDASYD